VDVLIFDMDGVLIDVSHSYRKTIQQTIFIYLETCLGIRADLVSPEEISLFKSAGGFNNDWDLTSGFLLYLLSISRVPPLPKHEKLSSLDEVVLYLRLQLSSFHQRKDLKLKNTHFHSFLERVKTLGGGMNGVRASLGDSLEGWVYGSGNLEKENLVKRIFQEVYLGKEFASHYHLQPLFYRGKGLYLREKLLIGREVLSSLHKKVRLGIASGRPRFEAELALKRFHLSPYFKSVVTLDEIEEEEERILLSTGKKIRRSKPHPYSLLRVAQEIGIPDARCGYVGDVLDDMLAARSAQKILNMLAIGYLSGRGRQKSQEELLRKAGADHIIKNPKELFRIIA
jgi:HAD superfamily hydrolase (TIGR01548 family)